MNNKYIAAYPRLNPTDDAPCGARLFSGRQVIDEVVIDGRYVCRWRNCSGQVYPDMHYPKNKISAVYGDVKSQAFTLIIDNKEVDDWTLEGFCESTDTLGLFSDGKTYELSLLSEKHSLRARVITRLDGGELMARKLRIENLSDNYVAFDAVYPLSGAVFTHYTDFWYRKDEALTDTSAPYSVAYCHDTRWGHEGDFYFDKVKEKVSFSSIRGKSGWNRPSFWLRNAFSGETFVCEFAYSGNWSANVDYTQTPFGTLDYEAHPFGMYNQTIHALSACIGITAPKGEAVRVLAPKESVDTPVVVFGTFRSSDDEITHALHSFVRHSVLPPLPENYPICEIEGNHRGYLCDRETHDGIMTDIDAIAETGCELYIFDAGWYGGENAKNRCWPAYTGDWTPAPWLEHGLKPIAAKCHEKGMRFGLWSEIEAVGWESQLIKEHSDWQIMRHGNVCAGTLDLSRDDVEKWITDEILRMIDEYDVDLWRIDHNKDIGLGGTRSVGGFTENTLWRYYDGFYRVFRSVRAARPNIALQNCAGGGGRLDLGVMNVFHNTELSDWHRAPRGLRILSNMTMLLPPEILLRGFSTESGDLPMDVDLESQIRAVMLSRPTFRGAAPTVSEFSPYLKSIYDKYSDFYKSFMRPLFADCKVYHHTPFLHVNEACPWIVTEYVSADKNSAVAAVFAVSDDALKDSLTFHLRLRGLDRSKAYEVTYMSDDKAVTVSGHSLMNDGLHIKVSHHMSSEMLKIKAI